SRFPRTDPAPPGSRSRVHCTDRVGRFTLRGVAIREDTMNGRRSAANSTKAAKPAGRLSKAEVHAASPYGYAYADWLAREDPEYMRARAPLSQLSFGEGKELAVKYREMVIIGILAFRGLH